MLYEKKIPSEGHSHFAIDTETTRFRVQKKGWKGKTHVEPFGGHTLVLGSVVGFGRGVVLRRNDLIRCIHKILARDVELVFHNAVFDINVLIDADPSLKEPFVRAIEAGRIHDTKILETLVRIATGAAGTSTDLFRGTSLKDLAMRYAGMALNKDPLIRMNFGDFQDPTVPIPERSLEYALEDAEATWRVYAALIKKARRAADVPNCRYPIHDDAEKKFGVLGEKIQIMGSLALSWLSSFPLRVDGHAANKLRAKFEYEVKRLASALITFKWAHRKKDGSVSLSFKKLRTVLAEWAKAHKITPEYSDTGLVKLEYDFWAQHLPRITDDLLKYPSGANTLEDKLSVWLRYARSNKTLNTYLYCYESSPVHFPSYLNIGARTTRTSCRKPNVQNIPKRRDSLRSMFIPAPGRIFIEADYSSAELVALAQIWHSMFGGSALGDAINQGSDPHASCAGRLCPDDWEAALAAGDEPAKKNLRQMAKAVNFGLPGGLGAATFSKFARGYGLDLDLDMARHLRMRALDAEPSLAKYLSDERDPRKRLALAARNLGIPFDDLIGALHARRSGGEGYHPLAAIKRLFRWARGKDTDRYSIPTPPGFNKRWDLWKVPTRSLTGFVRRNASFCEARNTPFQALVADASKIAGFELWKRWCPVSAWAPVAFVHDSYLLEVDKGYEDVVGAILQKCMLAGINTVCPDIRGGVDLEQKERWGK
jgi:hypothetical protein